MISVLNNPDAHRPVDGIARRLLVFFLTLTIAPALADTDTRIFTATSDVYRELNGQNLGALNPDALLALGYTARMFGNSDMTQAVLDRLSASHPYLDPEREALRLYIEGAHLQWAVDYDGAQDRLTRAAQLASSVGAFRVAAEALKASAYTFAIEENFGDATRVLRQLQALDAQTDDPYVAALVEESLGEVNGYSARYSRSLEHYKRAAKLYDSLGYRARLHEVMLGEATTYRYMDDKAAALASVERYLHQLDEDNSAVSRFFGRYTLAMTLAEQQDCAAAIPAIKAARALGGPPDFEGELAKQLAHCELESNNIAAAAEAIREANQLLYSKVDLDDTASGAESWRITAEIMFREGDSESAYLALSKYVQAIEASEEARREQVMVDLLDQADADQHEAELMRLERLSAEQALLVSQQQSSRDRLVYAVVLMTVLTLTLMIFYVLQRKRSIALDRMRDELEIARDAAESASDVKSEFLANMSHEMRTPMNAIIGLCRLALGAEMNPRQRDYLKKIQVSAAAMLNIINEVLDLSKIESGQLEMERISFSIDDLLDDLASVMSTAFEEKGLEFLFDRDPSLPAILQGDPHRLNQILLNLTGNARKFTDRGGIVVRVRVISRQSGQVLLRFAVEDSGIGIEPEVIDQLFQPFVQGDKSTTRKYGGTGLGLTICRRLCDLMGGRIWVGSTPGQGSTFHVELPFGVPDLGASVVDDQWDNSLGSVRILVVDDNIIAQQILQENLRYFGFDAVSVGSAEEAYAVLRENDATTPFEVVLMDYRLPDTDGLSAATQVRESIGLQHVPRIALVTAVSGMVLSESEYRRRSVDQILSKPVNLQLLFRTVKDLATNGAPSARPLAESDDAFDLIKLAPIRGARILLVEDNHINQQVAIEYLSNAGLVVEVADNGEQALAILRTKRFDCVLMDLQMPVMDGYAATRRIRENPDWSDLPVLAMTANVMPEDRARVLDAGMNGHIGKPFSPTLLFSTLLEWIKPVSVQDATSVMEGSAATETSDLMDIDLPRQLGGTEIDRALRNVNNNRPLLMRLLIELEQDHREDVRRLHEFIANDDFDAANRITHTLKGICGSLGLEAERQAAYELERRIAQQDLAGARVACERFSALLGAVLADLAGWRSRHNHQLRANEGDADQRVVALAEQRAAVVALRQAIDDMDLVCGDLARQLLAQLDEDIGPLGVQLVEAGDALEFDRAAEILDQLVAMLPQLAERD